MKKQIFLKFAGLVLAAALTVGCFAGCKKADNEKPELTIGITYFAPMNYLEGEELTGFETEFAKAVCEKIGMTPKFQKIVWETKEVELNGNSIDCIWNGMTINDEIRKNMEVSTTYMQNRQVVVVLKENLEKYKDLADLNDVKIVAEAESAGEKVAKQNDAFQGASYTAVDSQATALMEVKSKTADMCIVDYVLTIGSIGEGTNYEDLAVIDKDFSPEEYGIAFKKGNTELRDKVNNAMQELANEGKLNEIAAKYKLQDFLLVKPNK